MTALRAGIAAPLLLLGLPLASGLLAGLPPGLLELPPETIHVHPPDYSAPLYALLSVLMLVIAALYVAPRRFGFTGTEPSDFRAFDWAFAAAAPHPLPRWGWLGVVLVAASWPAAWLRPEWLGAAADHTFFPLWLGYILTVDALVYRRCGASPLTRWRAAWLGLFPASALTWWYFELLNRFIQNWIYIGVEDFTAARYIIGATAAFATVIPAVLTTAALLSTYPGLRVRFVRPTRPAAQPGGRVWEMVITAGSIGLLLMPWFPVPLFALIWLAPWLVVAGLLERGGRPTGLGHLLRGDWGPIMTLGAAALVCGLFWELWNFFSMPKWIYQVPWLDRYKLFEMPLVGYLGYLPFGPACWAFWLLFQPRPTRRRGGASTSPRSRFRRIVGTPARRN